MSKKVAVIGVIGQKGGGGKTTIAINLAVAAARHKLAAVIIDLDQQTNSAKWRDRRRSDNVAVVATPASRITATIETAVTHGAQFIVIDSPGHNDNAATKAVRGSNLLAAFGHAVIRHESGSPDRCPNCGSYNLDVGFNPELAPALRVRV